MGYAFEMSQPLAARAAASERANFIRRTYLHLAGAILAFVFLEFLIFTFVPMETLNAVTFLRSPLSALLVVGAFIGVSMLARWWAFNGTSPAMAYAGLGLYVLAEAAIFVPLLHIAINYVRDPTILPTAGILTLSVFGGLTLAAFTTRKDFSFLGPILSIAFFLAIGVIVVACIFGFPLGLWFSLAMVGVACASILYDTSNIIHHFRTDQHVAASLSLFASVATLFYYILMVLLQSRE